VRLGTAESSSRLSGHLFYEWDKSEYESAIPYKFERAGLDVGVKIARTLGLVGDYGKVKDQLKGSQNISFLDTSGKPIAPPQ